MKIEEFSTAKFFLKQSHQLLLLLLPLIVILCFLYLSLSSLIFAKDEKWKF